MFWKYNTSSSVQIEALLQQENVSLQELMEEDELLQECKAQNKKVIDFLIQPEILEELVNLLVVDPSPDRELQVRFKYANLASELLTCDVPAIVDKVASSSNLLLMLYKFLEKDKPLNPLLASFVSKVFGMLVQRRTEQNWYSYQFTCFQVLDFLKSQGGFVEVAMKHIGTSAVMDLVLKLICGVDNDDQDIERGIHQWLNECRLIEQLVEKLTPDCDSEEHSSVDQLLCAIVSTNKEPTQTNGSDSQSNGSHGRLLATLESKEVINKLMDILLHEDRNESSVSHVINILLTLLSFRGSNKESNFHTSNSIEILHSDSLGSKNIVLGTIVARLPDLQKVLLQPTKLGKLTTAFGAEMERLGSTRLQVVNLIAALIATQDLHVHDTMAYLHTLQLLFDLFFKFSLNNFLHTQVTQCVTYILNQPPSNHSSACPVDGEGSRRGVDGLNNNPLQTQMENGEECGDGGGEKADDEHHTSQHPLLVQLFSECKIIEKILECCSDDQEEEDETAEKKLHNLVGYMGHIREIANAIVQSHKEGPCSAAIDIEMKKLSNDVLNDWEDFALITLAEINLKNKIIPLQGFKGSDMDSIGDMRFVDDFKDAEESLGGTQRISCQMGDDVDAQGLNAEDAFRTSMEKFEEYCAEKSLDILEFEDMWKDKERDVTFEAHQKPADAEDEDENQHSSSEEEADLDDEFDSIRTTDEKMDVDFGNTDWDVFDKRGNNLPVDEGFNPWRSAPNSETDGSGSWADFGASPFGSSCNDPFTAHGAGPATTDGSGSQFQSTFTSISRESSINRESILGFHADFSKAFNSSTYSDSLVEEKKPDLESNFSTVEKFESNLSKIEKFDPNSGSIEKFDSNLEKVEKIDSNLGKVEKCDSNLSGVKELESNISEVEMKSKESTESTSALTESTSVSSEMQPEETSTRSPTQQSLQDDCDASESPIKEQQSTLEFALEASSSVEFSELSSVHSEELHSATGAAPCLPSSPAPPSPIPVQEVEVADCDAAQPPSQVQGEETSAKPQTETEIPIHLSPGM